ncbi:hypothetical protein COO60DRAFT_1608204, partial [Scenedesmus sp. NREL 46B-D3]
VKSSAGSRQHTIPFVGLFYMLGGGWLLYCSKLLLVFICQFLCLAMLPQAACLARCVCLDMLGCTYVPLLQHAAASTSSGTGLAAGLYVRGWAAVQGDHTGVMAVSAA